MTGSEKNQNQSSKVELRDKIPQKMEAMEEKRTELQTRAMETRENMARKYKTQTGAARLEQLRKRIQRTGKMLSGISKIVQLFLGLSMIFFFIAMVMCFFDHRAVAFARNFYERNALYLFIRQMAGLNGMDEKYQAAIGCAIALLTNLTLVLFLRSAKQFIRPMTEGGKPFSIEVAKKMRKTAWVMLLLMLYNVPLGLISSALVFMFSFLMEYGGYIQEQADETSRIQEEIIVSFAEITENKSGQTGQHIRRVSEYARILATQLGLPQEEVENIRIASTMHDVGKLMIPSEILEKPGKLTDEEYETIKTHTTYGGELLKNVEGEEMALSRTIALEHHERVDGRGYPAHLSGDEISMEAKIVAVADVYDALTSRRSYKNAWKEEDAYQEILRGRGTQFDAEVVDAFIAAHDEIAEVQRRLADPV